MTDAPLEIWRFRAPYDDRKKDLHLFTESAEVARMTKSISYLRADLTLADLKRLRPDLVQAVRDECLEAGE